MNTSAGGLRRWKHNGWGMGESDESLRSQGWTRRRSGGDAATLPRGCICSPPNASDALELEGRPPRRNPPLSIQHLMQLVDVELAGDPNSDLRWVRRSLRKLQRAMQRVGLGLCPHTIGRILSEYKIRPKGNVKHLMPRPHPDRDRQFRHIQTVRKRFEKAGWPIISVDTKKKELVGLFSQRGQVWTHQGTDVYTYDFPSDATEKVNPYGVYDVQKNQGSVYIGLDADTPDFAADAIQRWWREQGRKLYPGASHLLILADGGGSNGYRPRRFKTQVQKKLADAFGLAVTVCHYPPGAAKWNPVEHRLFSQIRQTWAGTPLISLPVVLSAIRSTTTHSGLRVTASVLPGPYPQNLHVSPKEWADLRIRRHKICPQWNYTILPHKTGK
jgi:hypothetical protein